MDPEMGRDREPEIGRDMGPRWSGRLEHAEELPMQPQEIGIHREPAKDDPLLGGEDADAGQTDRCQIPPGEPPADLLRQRIALDRCAHRE